MKKGQITTFVIIGVVFIIIVAIAIYVVSILNKPVDVVKQYTEVVPPAFPPITGFLQAFASKKTIPKPSVSPSGIVIFGIINKSHKL